VQGIKSPSSPGAASPGLKEPRPKAPPTHQFDFSAAAKRYSHLSNFIVFVRHSRCRGRHLLPGKCIQLLEYRGGYRIGIRVGVHVMDSSLSVVPTGSVC
jgi:hypothetical protein